MTDHQSQDRARPLRRPRGRVVLSVVGALAVLVAAGLTGCSGSSSPAADKTTTTAGSAAGGTTTTTATTTATTGGTATSAPGSSAAPTPGPAATISPLTGGKGVRLLAALTGPDLKAAGYVQDEYKAAGTAVSYRAVDGLPTNGRYQLAPAGSASYATRIIVRRPADPAKFNGTIAVEWLNVSSGADSAPDYTYMADELIRGGYGWVGVSAQRIGIDGGAVAVAAPDEALTGAGKGIAHLDPARYGSLHHPGDAYSYDMYTQVARALRSTTADNPFHGFAVKHLLAVGESQSAFTLTTYADGVQPLTHEFDGFLIHSRGGAPAPLGTPGAGIDIAGSLSGKPTIIRTDLDVPVIMVETETDVLGLIGYLPAVQPDTDRIKLWEVAGTSHADLGQVGAAVEPLLGCSVPINRGQQDFVLRSAISHLNSWAAGGAPPPTAPRFDIVTKGGKPTFAVDANGNVEGGIRTPSVDAPVATLSGLAPAKSSIICLLMGSTIQLPAARLHALYPTRAAYVSAYAAATDRAITSGFVLAQDRTALIAASQPDLVTG